MKTHEATSKNEFYPTNLKLTKKFQAYASFQFKAKRHKNMTMPQSFKKDPHRQDDSVSRPINCEVIFPFFTKSKEQITGIGKDDIDSKFFPFDKAGKQALAKKS